MPRTTRPRSGVPALPTTFPTPPGALAVGATRTGGAHALPTQRPSRRAAAPAGPLGSLVTAADAGCARCGGASVTRLAVTAPGGAPVTFVSCHSCESRTWLAADGAALALDAVLSSDADA